jgi:hypothetical protein
MSSNLEELARLLHEGQTRSGQTSFRRRAPSPQSLTALLQARNGLRRAVEDEPDNLEAWRLLSQAEEALLNYAEARLLLERVLALVPRPDRRDLKRLALLRECEAWWRGMGLTPTQLAGLGDHLEGTLSGIPCDHTLRITRAWLQQSEVVDPDAITEALRERGGSCDCEVLSNVVT